MLLTKHSKGSPFGRPKKTSCRTTRWTWPEASIVSSGTCGLRPGEVVFWLRSWLKMTGLWRNEQKTSKWSKKKWGRCQVTSRFKILACQLYKFGSCIKLCISKLSWPCRWKTTAEARAWCCSTRTEGIRLPVICEAGHLSYWHGAMGP